MAIFMQLPSEDERSRISCLASGWTSSAHLPILLRRPFALWMAWETC